MRKEMLALLKRDDLTKDEIREAGLKLEKYKRNNDDWQIKLVVKRRVE
jgi:hypothetical protein